MTSNLASEQIRENAPTLRTSVDAIFERPEEYERVIAEFKEDIYPTLKAALKRDEFLGRINQTVIFLPLSETEVTSLQEC